jgi:hypothetical protein
MTTEKKGAKVVAKETPKVKAEKKGSVMAHGEVQTKDNPPKVAKGMKAIWHEAYSYQGKNGMVTVRGHFEVAKEPEPKKVEPTK